MRFEKITKEQMNIILIESLYKDTQPKLNIVIYDGIVPYLLKIKEGKFYDYFSDSEVIIGDKYILKLIIKITDLDFCNLNINKVIKELM